MGYDSRPATHCEILDSHRSPVTGEYRRALYRHFVRETYNPKARDGVSHRQWSRAKLRDIGGVPHVMYQGKLEPVRGTHYTLPSGRSFVASLVIDSPYLK